MAPEILAFTTTPYKKEDVCLASLVPDKHRPNQDVKFKSPVVPEVDYAVDLDLNFAGRIEARSDSSFAANLTRIFATGMEKSQRHELVVKAEKGFIYELRQPSAVFERLCEEEAVRKWLQGRQRLGKKSYFIIGYRTLVDAEMVRREGHTSGSKGRVTVPIGAGPRVDLIQTDQLDLKLHGGHVSGTNHEESMQAPGERIYAMCYRRVRLTFHPWKEGNLDLHGNRWKTTFVRRGYSPLEIVEASLEEEVADAFVQETITSVPQAVEDSKQEKFAFLSPEVD